MTIDTRDFGRMELDENEFITFVSPIYGYERLKRFALLSDDEVGNGLLWLQSAEEPETCFILIDPDEVGLPYAPELPRDMVEVLGLGEEAPVFRLVAVVPANFMDTTVNLKSPVVINPKTRVAAQVIVEADYPIRMPLFAGKEGD